MMSGLWLLPLGAFFYYSPWSKAFLDYLLFAGPVIGGLHSFLPLLAVFATGAFIEKLRPNRGKVIWMSLLVVGISMGLSVFGAVFGRPEFWLLVGYAYLLWNTWHFAAQNFGVLSLYRTAQDQNQAEDRNIDKYFCLTMGCVIQPIVWFCVEARWGPFVRWIPKWIPAEFVSYTVLIISLVMTIAYTIWELRKKNHSYQKIAYAWSIGLQPLAGIWAYYPFHFLAYSIPHWMVEIGITGTIQRGDTKKSPFLMPALKVTGFVLVALLLVYYVETPYDSDAVVFSWWDNLAWNEITRESLYVQWTIPVLVSFIAVPRSFLHFYLSRQIYKSTRWTLGKLRPSA